MDAFDVFQLSLDEEGRTESALLTHLEVWVVGGATKLKSYLATVQSEGANEICGKVFKSGDLAYNCRQCQADPTCVLCEACFRASDHKGHDVSFHRAGSGGTCDCGDTEAFSRCCDKHGPEAAARARASGVDAASALDTGIRRRLTIAAGHILRLVSTVARDTAYAYHLDPETLASPRAVADAACSSGSGGGSGSVDATSASSSSAGVASAAVPAPPPPGGSAVNSGSTYSVLLHNDDIHTYQEVTSALKTHVRGMTPATAASLTEAVDKAGEAAVVVGKPLADVKAAMRGLATTGLHYSAQTPALQRRQVRCAALVKWLAGHAAASEAVAKVVADVWSTGGATHDDDDTDSGAAAAGSAGSAASGGAGTASPAAPAAPAACVPIVSPRGLVCDAIAAAGAVPCAPEEALYRVTPRVTHGPAALALLVRWDAYTQVKLRSLLHGLYTQLLKHAHFRASLGACMVAAYPSLAVDFGRGFGTASDSVLDLGVQLFTVPTIVYAGMEQGGDLPSAAAAQLWRALSLTAAPPDELIVTRTTPLPARVPAGGSAAAAVAATVDAATAAVAAAARVHLQQYNTAASAAVPLPPAGALAPALRRLLTTGAQGASSAGRAVASLLVPAAAAGAPGSPRGASPLGAVDAVVLSFLTAASGACLGPAPELDCFTGSGMLTPQAVLALQLGRPLPPGAGDMGSLSRLLEHARYQHAIRDLEYILRNAGVANAVWKFLDGRSGAGGVALPSASARRALARSGGPWPPSLPALLQVMRLVQGANPQTRKRGEHVQYEGREWLAAFNLALQVSAVAVTLIGNTDVAPVTTQGVRAANSAGSAASGGDAEADASMAGAAAALAATDATAAAATPSTASDDDGDDGSAAWLQRDHRHHHGKSGHHHGAPASPSGGAASPAPGAPGSSAIAPLLRPLSLMDVAAAMWHAGAVVAEDSAARRFRGNACGAVVRAALESTDDSALPTRTQERRLYDATAGAMVLMRHAARSLQRYAPAGDATPAAARSGVAVESADDGAGAAAIAHGASRRPTTVTVAVPAAAAAADATESSADAFAADAISSASPPARHALTLQLNHATGIGTLDGGGMMKPSSHCVAADPTSLHATLSRFVAAFGRRVLEAGSVGMEASVRVTQAHVDAATALAAKRRGDLDGGGSSSHAALVSACLREVTAAEARVAVEEAVLASAGVDAANHAGQSLLTPTDLAPVPVAALLPGAVAALEASSHADKVEALASATTEATLVAAAAASAGTTVSAPGSPILSGAGAAGRGLRDAVSGLVSDISARLAGGSPVASGDAAGAAGSVLSGVASRLRDAFNAATGASGSSAAAAAPRADAASAPASAARATGTDTATLALLRRCIVVEPVLDEAKARAQLQALAAAAGAGSDGGQAAGDASAAAAPGVALALAPRVGDIVSHELRVSINAGALFACSAGFTAPRALALRRGMQTLRRAHLPVSAVTPFQAVAALRLSQAPLQRGFAAPAPAPLGVPRNPALLLALVEPSLRAIVLASQGKAGLWVRNGESMAMQVENYAETPQCLHFYEADIAVAIAALASGSGGLRPQHAFSLLADRFGLRGWFEGWATGRPQEPLPKDAAADAPERSRLAHARRASPRLSTIAAAGTDPVDALAVDVDMPGLKGGSLNHSFVRDEVHGGGDTGMVVDAPLTLAQQLAILPHFFRLLCHITTETLPDTAATVAPRNAPFAEVEGRGAALLHAVGAGASWEDELRARVLDHQDDHAAAQQWCAGAGNDDDAGIVSAALAYAREGVFPDHANDDEATIGTLETLLLDAVERGEEDEEEAVADDGTSGDDDGLTRAPRRKRHRGRGGSPVWSASMPLGASGLGDATMGRASATADAHIEPVDDAASAAAAAGSGSHVTLAVTSPRAAQSADALSCHLRRALIHALASGPKPRSALIKAAQAVYARAKRVDEAAVTEALASLCDYRAPTGMESGVYVLKDAHYESYDQYYIHLKPAKHAEARGVWMEKRSRATATAAANSASKPAAAGAAAATAGATRVMTPLATLATARPLAPRPLPAHPAVVGARRVLHTVGFAHAVRCVLLAATDADAAATATAGGSGTADAATAGQLHDDAALMAAVHALTLAVHTWPTGGAAPVYSVTGAAANDHQATVADVFASALCAERLVLPYGGPAGATPSATTSGGSAAPASEASAAAEDSANDADASSSSSSVSGTRRTREEAAAGALAAVDVAEAGTPEHPMTLAQWLQADASVRAAARLDASSRGANGSPLAPAPGPSVIALLYGLHKRTSAAPEVREGAAWVLQQLRSLHPLTAAAVATALGPDIDAAAALERAEKEAQRKAELDARKKAAQARAMAAMASKQASFMKTMTTAAGGDDDEEDEEEGGAASAADAAAAAAAGGVLGVFADYRPDAAADADLAGGTTTAAAAVDAGGSVAGVEGAAGVAAGSGVAVMSPVERRVWRRRMLHSIRDKLRALAAGVAANRSALLVTATDESAGGASGATTAAVAAASALPPGAGMDSTVAASADAAAAADDERVLIAAIKAEEQRLVTQSPSAGAASSCASSSLAVACERGFQSPSCILCGEVRADSPAVYIAYAEASNVLHACSDDAHAYRCLRQEKYGWMGSAAAASSPTAAAGSGATGTAADATAAAALAAVSDAHREALYGRTFVVSQHHEASTTGDLVSNELAEQAMALGGDARGFQGALHTTPASISTSATRIPASQRTYAPSTLDAGVAFTFCGHVAHSDCIQGYLVSAADRSRRGLTVEGENHLRYTDGEFQCPLCRSLSNALVPHEASAWPLAPLSRGDIAALHKALPAAMLTPSVPRADGSVVVALNEAATAAMAAPVSDAGDESGGEEGEASGVGHITTSTKAPADFAGSSGDTASAPSPRAHHPQMRVLPADSTGAWERALPTYEALASFAASAIGGPSTASGPLTAQRYTPAQTAMLVATGLGMDVAAHAATHADVRELAVTQLRAAAASAAGGDATAGKPPSSTSVARAVLLLLHFARVAKALGLLPAGNESPHVPDAAAAGAASSPATSSGGAVAASGVSGSATAAGSADTLTRLASAARPLPSLDDQTHRQLGVSSAARRITAVGSSGIVRPYLNLARASAAPASGSDKPVPGTDKPAQPPQHTPVRQFASLLLSLAYTLRMADVSLPAGDSGAGDGGCSGMHAGHVHAAPSPLAAAAAAVAAVATGAGITGDSSSAWAQCGDAELLRGTGFVPEPSAGSASGALSSLVKHRAAAASLLGMARHAAAVVLHPLFQPLFSEDQGKALLRLLRELPVPSATGTALAGSAQKQRQPLFAASADTSSLDLSAVADLLSTRFAAALASNGRHSKKHGSRRVRRAGSGGGAADVGADGAPPVSPALPAASGGDAAASSSAGGGGSSSSDVGALDLEAMLDEVLMGGGSEPAAAGATGTNGIADALSAAAAALAAAAAGAVAPAAASDMHEASEEEGDDDEEDDEEGDWYGDDEEGDDDDDDGVPGAFVNLGAGGAYAGGPGGADDDGDEDEEEEEEEEDGDHKSDDGTGAAGGGGAGGIPPFLTNALQGLAAQLGSQLSIPAEQMAVIQEALGIPPAAGGGGGGGAGPEESGGLNIVQLLQQLMGGPSAATQATTAAAGGSAGRGHPSAAAPTPLPTLASLFPGLPQPAAYEPLVHHPLRAALAQLLVRGEVAVAAGDAPAGATGSADIPEELAALLIAGTPLTSALPHTPAAAAAAATAASSADGDASSLAVPLTLSPAARIGPSTATLYGDAAAALRAVRTHYAAAGRSLRLLDCSPAQLFLLLFSLAPTVDHALHAAAVAYTVALAQGATVAGDDGVCSATAATTTIPALRFIALVLRLLTPVEVEAPAAAAAVPAATAAAGAAAGDAAAAAGVESAAPAAGAGAPRGVLWARFCSFLSTVNDKLAAAADSSVASAAVAPAPGATWDCLLRACGVVDGSPASNARHRADMARLHAATGAVLQAASSPDAPASAASAAAARTLVAYARPVASLVDLPLSFDALYGRLAAARCDACDTCPEEPALCLACGEVLCAGTACCKRGGVGTTPVGECTLHARLCGGGTGMFLLGTTSQVVLLRGEWAAYAPSPYVDSHGEQDIGLRRGKPLALEPRRYAVLRELWAKGGVGREVSRLRNSADRIVRPNFY